MSKELFTSFLDLQTAVWKGWDNEAVSKECFDAGYDAAMLAEHKSNWISIDDGLPALQQQVIVFRPSRKGQVAFDMGIKGRIDIAYLFYLNQGERYGYIRGLNAGEEISLWPGGKFWAFPAIIVIQAVSHWMPLPPLPGEIVPNETMKLKAELEYYKKLANAAGRLFDNTMVHEEDQHDGFQPMLKEYLELKQNKP